MKKSFAAILPIILLVTLFTAKTTYAQFSQQGCFWFDPLCQNKCGLAASPDPDPLCEDHYDDETACLSDTDTYTCSLPPPPPPPPLRNCVWSGNPIGYGGNCHPECALPEYTTECDVWDSPDANYEIQCQQETYTCELWTGYFRCSMPPPFIGQCIPCESEPDCIYATYNDCLASNCQLPEVTPEPTGFTFMPDTCACPPGLPEELCADNPPIETAFGCISTHPFSFLSDVRDKLIPLGSGIALLLMVIGAFFVLVSQGQPEYIKRGKEIFVGAIIGLLFMIFSIFMVHFIFQDLLILWD